MARRPLAATFVAAAVLAASTAHAGGTNILIFSETAAFRHDSIPDAVAAEKCTSRGTGVALAFRRRRARP